ncbi:MAG: hypothetical protein QM740_21295 [Acidovorax sp.]
MQGQLVNMLMDQLVVLAMVAYAVVSAFVYGWSVYKGRDDGVILTQIRTSCL